jgi:hypothetical protein
VILPQDLHKPDLVLREQGEIPLMPQPNRSLVLDCSISDYENEDDDADETFAQTATIWAVRSTRSITRGRIGIAGGISAMAR